MNVTGRNPLTVSRFQSIDALRGIAALGVVFYHALWQNYGALPNNFFRRPVQFLQFLSSFGYIGVFLFFVISGFCIHLQWARSQAKQEPHDVRFGSFWRRRIRRLYPPYLITLALFLVVWALTTRIDLTHFFFYDIVMHVLMLHNLDPHTCYSINGVFWTLAVEEQLYLAYFLLLFLRKRWGWTTTLLICAAARVGWYGLSHLIWIKFGVGVPVPEGAASHWFTWALGAIAVEAAFGLVKLPDWCRNLWLGGAAIVIASATSMILPHTQKDTFPHTTVWLLMHPAWGLGFFIVVNRVVRMEQEWMRGLRGAVENLQRFSFARLSRKLVVGFAFIGVFSYSLYLTHELVIMQSWWFISRNLPPILNTLLLVVPATVVSAWFFYTYCEQPFIRKPTEPVLLTEEPVVEVRREEARVEESPASDGATVFAQSVPVLADETNI